MDSLNVIRNANLFKITEDTNIVILGGDKTGTLFIKDGNCYLREKFSSHDSDLIKIETSDYVRILENKEVYNYTDTLKLKQGTYIELLNKNIVGKLLCISNQKYILKDDNTLLKISIENNKKYDVIILGASSEPKSLGERLEEYKRNKRMSLGE